jgi:hypothetical protein
LFGISFALLVGRGKSPSENCRADEDADCDGKREADYHEENTESAFQYYAKAGICIDLNGA